MSVLKWLAFSIGMLVRGDVGVSFATITPVKLYIFVIISTTFETYAVQCIIFDSRF